MRGVEQLGLRDTPGGAVLPVKVVPHASRDRVAGLLGDCLKIATTAPPEGGKANAAVAKLLARALGLRDRDVQLLAGASSPRKEFLLNGMAAQAARETLARLP